MLENQAGLLRHDEQFRKYRLSTAEGYIPGFMREEVDFRECSSESLGLLFARRTSFEARFSVLRKKKEGVKTKKDKPVISLFMLIPFFREKSESCIFDLFADFRGRVQCYDKDSEQYLVKTEKDLRAVLLRGVEERVRGKLKPRLRQSGSVVEVSLREREGERVLRVRYFGLVWLEERLYLVHLKQLDIGSAGVTSTSFSGLLKQEFRQVTGVRVGDKEVLFGKEGAEKWKGMRKKSWFNESELWELGRNKTRKEVLKEVA